jgi:hypothetical protein
MPLTTSFPDVAAARCKEIEKSGFAIVSSVISAGERQALIDVLGPLSAAGRRGLLAEPAVTSWARSSHVLDLVRPHLAAEPFPVRAIYFDKCSETNWVVPWHQDVMLAVRSRADISGFGSWSTKNGIPHVQPPVEFLQQMLTVRLHFDHTDDSNGALRVLPGSHCLGRLCAARIEEVRREQPEILCEAFPGDVLLMRPMLLHASSRSTSARHRRVLHIEYAGFSLPHGLEWHPAA